MVAGRSGRGPRTGVGLIVQGVELRADGRESAVVPRIDEVDEE